MATKKGAQAIKDWYELPGDSDVSGSLIAEMKESLGGLKANVTNLYKIIAAFDSLVNEGGKRVVDVEMIKIDVLRFIQLATSGGWVTEKSDAADWALLVEQRISLETAKLLEEVEIASQKTRSIKQNSAKKAAARVEEIIAVKGGEAIHGLKNSPHEDEYKDRVTVVEDAVGSDEEDGSTISPAEEIADSLGYGKSTMASVKLTVPKFKTGTLMDHVTRFQIFAKRARLMVEDYEAYFADSLSENAEAQEVFDQLRADDMEAPVEVLIDALIDDFDNLDRDKVEKRRDRIRQGRTEAVKDFTVRFNRFLRLYRRYNPIGDLEAAIIFLNKLLNAEEVKLALSSEDRMNVRLISKKAELVQQAKNNTRRGPLVNGGVSSNFAQEGLPKDNRRKAGGRERRGNHVSGVTRGNCFICKNPAISRPSALKGRNISIRQKTQNRSRSSWSKQRPLCRDRRH